MTKKTARKVAARALQTKQGGRYQSALRAQGPDNIIRRRHADLMRLYEEALVQCALALDHNKYEGHPELHVGLTFYFPFAGNPSTGGHGPQIRCFPTLHLKDPLPQNLKPTTHKAESEGPGPFPVADAEKLRELLDVARRDPDFKVVQNPVPDDDLKTRMLQAFMVLNSGLGFTGHLAPTREQLLGRINQACSLLAGPTDHNGKPIDELVRSLKHHRWPFETEDVTFSRVTVTFRVQPPGELRHNWPPGAVLKRCTAPKLRLVGVTDGATVRWTTLTSIKDDPEFAVWVRALPEAEPYARFENDLV